MGKGRTRKRGSRISGGKGLWVSRAQRECAERPEVREWEDRNGSYELRDLGPSQDPTVAVGSRSAVKAERSLERRIWGS